MILIVDDDSNLQQLHALYLNAAGHKTLCANNGLEALALLQQHDGYIDLIISDVVMPEMDGFDLCKMVREVHVKNRLPFVFVSSLDTLEEKMAGYSAGGDDFINKPVEPQVLTEKVKILLGLQKKTSEIQTQLNESSSAAMQAMTYSSQIGQVLDFFKQSIRAKTLQDIANYLFDFLNNQGLVSTIQFHLPGGIQTYGSQGEVTPLESNLIEMVHKEKRFYDFGARTAINYANFTLLIKNMPINNPELYGTLKDTLGNLCEAIETRVDFLLAENKTKQREQVLQVVQKTLEHLSASLENIHENNVSAIDDMIGDIDEAMITLGLTEVQENNIRGIASKTLIRVEDAFAQSEQLKAQFRDIQNKLIAILG